MEAVLNNGMFWGVLSIIFVLSFSFYMMHRDEKRAKKLAH